MDRPVVMLAHWLPDGMIPSLETEFPGYEFVDGRTPEAASRNLSRAQIVYGLPDHLSIEDAGRLRWLQLASAGVPGNLAPRVAGRKILVTNLAGLYGPSIAQHAFALLLYLVRNFHQASANQRDRRWDRGIAAKMRDLHGRTLGILGLGDIGRNVARVARGFGMRVVGIRRRPVPTPWTDGVHGPEGLHQVLREADHLVVAAPLTPHTEGMLGSEEFAAMKEGAVLINVSRGPIVQEPALVDALRNGPLFAAGLDVFASEPLATDHPLWSMPNVVVIPHIAGETVNWSDRPGRRFARNLRNLQAGEAMEGRVDLAQGY